MTQTDAQLLNVEPQLKNVLYCCLFCGRTHVGGGEEKPQGWHSDRHCTQRCRELWITRAVKEAGVGRRFLQASFESFQVAPETQVAFEACQKAAGELDHGLFIHGSVGAGKTHLLAAMVRKMLGERIADPDEVRFIPILELLEQVKRSWNTHDSEPYETIKQVQALFIDDLGMEIVRDWTFQLFLGVVSFRYNEDLPTFISSNLSERELLERYGSAVFSRMAQMCRLIRLDAPNFRMKRQHQKAAANGKSSSGA